MNVDAYLERIGYDGPRAATGAVLRDLQRAHLFHVPFENLVPTGGAIQSVARRGIPADLPAGRAGDPRSGVYAGKRLS